MKKYTTHKEAKTYSIVIAVLWTLFLAINFNWFIDHHRHQLNEFLYAQAEAYFNKDLSFRYWATSHGGVYVPTSDHTPPNPYLSHIPNRDFKNPDGKQLTLMNPAYMIRQMYEDYDDFVGAKSHITSLNPLRPENTPDSWERKALLKFESDAGIDEVKEFTTIEKKPFLRFMRPIITKDGCLKCHAKQGYKVGDIRGGISVSIPTEEIFSSYDKTKNELARIFIFIYILGCTGLYFSTRNYLKNIEQKEQAVEELVKSEEKFKTISDYTYAWEYWLGPEGKLIYISPSCKRVSGYEPDDFITNPQLLENIISPEDSLEFTKHLSDELENTTVCEKYFRIIHKDGHTVWINHICQPVYDNKGTYLGRRASNYEVTKRIESEQESKRLIKELQETMKQVKLLSGFLPICASCKKIRDDKGYWNQIESYIKEHSEAQFSHGICPECVEKLYPELSENMKNSTDST